MTAETNSARQAALRERLRASVVPASAADVQAPRGGIVLERFDSIEPVELRWLWPGRIPLGKLCLLVGDPGAGKSLLTIDIAARVTHGAAFPDGSQCEPGAVILLSAEDDAADTIRPRLDAAGADVGRVHLLKAVHLMTMDGSSVESSFSLERDVELLNAELKKKPEVRLLIVDPISAYLGGTDANANAEIRGLLAPLAEMAGRRGVSVICVSHLRKSSGPAVHRAISSIAFAAAARAVWGVAADHNDAGRRLFLPVKQNLSADIGGLGFRIEPVGDTPRLSWESSPVVAQADEILGIIESDVTERTARAEAEEWLRLELADGPLPTREVKRRASDAGLSWRTVERAKAALHVKPEHSGFGASGSWQWALPQRPPAKDRQPYMSKLAVLSDVEENKALTDSQTTKDRQGRQYKGELAVLDAEPTPRAHSSSPAFGSAEEEGCGSGQGIQEGEL